MNNPANATCESCPNWTLEGSDAASRGIGQCRLNPPTAIALLVKTSPLPTTPPVPQFFGVFPPTHKDNWCMQHPKRKVGTFLELQRAN